MSQTSLCHGIYCHCTCHGASGQLDSLRAARCNGAASVYCRGNGTRPIPVQSQTSCIFPPSSARAFNKKAKTGICNFFPRTDLFHISTRNFYSHSSAWCCLDLQGRMVCISPKMMCLLQAIILCPSSLWLVLHTKIHDMTSSASVVKTLAVTLINPSLCRIFVAVLVPASTLVFSPLPSPLWVVTLSGETQTWICIR